VWAYAGILIKHTSAEGFAGQYGAVIATVVVSIVALLAASAYVLLAKRRVLGYT
ncbi:MAG: tryptophan-rich sensory protein, partial [Chloroflexi bacterium]|nr:tryptophan-rich sensory protein [Chloroflexota bacterium]